MQMVGYVKSLGVKKVFFILRIINGFISQEIGKKMEKEWSSGRCIEEFFKGLDYYRYMKYFRLCVEISQGRYKG